MPLTPYPLPFSIMIAYKSGRGRSCRCACVRCDRCEPCVTVLTRRSSSLCGIRATAGCSRPIRTPDGRTRTAASPVADRQRSKAAHSLPAGRTNLEHIEIERTRNGVRSGVARYPAARPPARSQYSTARLRRAIDRLVEHDQRQHIGFVERRLAREVHLWLTRRAADFTIAVTPEMMRCRYL